MITIVGAGRVGSSIALQIIERELDDVTLIDVIDGLPEGEALDLGQVAAERGIDVKVFGSNNFESMKDSDIVVVTAGLARKPGMTRMDLLSKNASIMKSICEKIKIYAKNSIVVPVANPLDVNTYVALKATGFDSKRVFGMGGMLDLSRFKYILSNMTGISGSSIQALVIGQHGESMLPLPRHSYAWGVPITNFLSETQVKESVEQTRQIAAKVIKLKGATVYAPANGVARMLDAIVKDKKSVIPVCAYLDGEYGVEGLCIGVPAIIGRDGISKIIEVELNEEEKNMFNQGVNSIKEGITSLE